MNAFLSVIIVLAIGAVSFIVLSLAFERCVWLRKKMNKPRIGKWCFLCDLLDRDDYVSIDGKVKRFSHITRPNEAINCIMPPSNDNKTLGGELAFYGRGLGYDMYYVSVLEKCEFVYGKYGVKWALSDYWASVAKEKVEEFKVS